MTVLVKDDAREAARTSLALGRCLRRIAAEPSGNSGLS